MNHRIAAVCAASLVALTATSARADQGWEPSAFLGAHIFSEDNDLGVREGTDNSIQNSVVLGLRLLYGFTPMLGAEAELGVLPTASREGGAAVIGLGYRVHGIAQFMAPGARFRPFVLLGVGGMSAISADPDVLATDTNFMIQAGAGVKLRLGASYGLRLDGRLLLPPARESSVTTDLEITLGFYKNFGSTDDIVKAVKSVTDLDGDGLFGDADKCPEVAEDPDGFQDEDGCPEEDNDGDGIMDVNDRCPDQPETVNQFDDGDGCPDEVPEVVKQFSGTIEGITFKLNSDEILPSSFKLLDRAVGVLKEYPSLAIEIQGHTDNVGAAEYNLDLSQRRADSVRRYMVKQGADEKRITAVGYGLTQPLMSNDTPEGRAKNRRVEFKRK